MITIEETECEGQNEGIGLFRDQQAAIVWMPSERGAEFAAPEQRKGKTRAIKQGMRRELFTGRTRLV